MVKLLFAYQASSEYLSEWLCIPVAASAGRPSFIYPGPVLHHMRTSTYGQRSLPPGMLCRRLHVHRRLHCESVRPMRHGQALSSRDCPIWSIKHDESHLLHRKWSFMRQCTVTVRNVALSLRAAFVSILLLFRRTKASSIDLVVQFVLYLFVYLCLFSFRKEQRAKLAKFKV